MKRAIVFITALLFPLPGIAKMRQLFELDYNSTSFLYARDTNDIDEFETLDVRYLYHFDNERHFIWHSDTRLRIDFTEPNRNRYAPHEAYISLYNPNWDFNLGLKKVFWGSGLAYNPVDVLNRSDLEANYLVREKLSDPIVELVFHSQNRSNDNRFSWHAYALPYFLKTPLPGAGSRFDLSGTQNGVPYTVSDDQDVPDYWDRFGYGTSFNLTIGSWETQVLYAHGPSHLPGYVLKVNSDGALELRPFYYTLDTVGIDTTLTLGRFTLKAQGAYKITDDNPAKPHDIQPVSDDAIPPNTWEYLAGIDYEHTLASGSGVWLLSVEYLGAHRDGAAFSNPLFFDNDIQVAAHYLSQKGGGLRWQTGLIKDIQTREWVLLTDMSARLRDSFRVGGALFYTHAADASALSLFDNTSYLKAYVSYAWGKNE